MKGKIKKNKIFIRILVAVFVIGLILLSPSTTKSTVDDKTVKSIVQIKCVTDEGTWFGSGVVVSSDGYIITNKHVVAGESQIYTGCDVGITESESASANFLYKADTIIAAPGVDLALLKIKSSRTDFNYVSIYPYALPKLGTEIEALGYPGIGGNTITYTRGYTSGIVGSTDNLGNYFIKADINIDAGNSGGGSFIGADEFAGITSAVLAGKYNTLGLIIPTATIRDFLYVNSYNFLIHGEKTNKGQDKFYDYEESSNVNDDIPADGSIVKTVNSYVTDYKYISGFYLIDDGYKRPIKWETVFESCFKWEDAMVVDDSILNKIPLGGEVYEITSGVCYIPKEKRIIRQFPDGTLIQIRFRYLYDFWDHTIYLIEEGKKRPFTSREVFEALGYKWWKDSETREYNITYVEEEEFYQYPIGQSITIENPPKPKPKLESEPKPESKPNSEIQAQTEAEQPETEDLSSTIQENLVEELNEENEVLPNTSANIAQFLNKKSYILVLIITAIALLLGFGMGMFLKKKR